MNPTEFRSQTLNELLPELFAETGETISPSAAPETGAPPKAPANPQSADAPNAEADPDEPQEDPNFSFDGYQVVRGEFFSHMNEPSISLCGGKISFNSACLKKAPEHDFVLVMVNPESRTMAVMPTPEETKDAIRWRNAAGKPRIVGCGIVIGMIVHLMGWHPEYRYKMIGKAIRRNGRTLFVFDLRSAEIYPRYAVDAGGRSRFLTARSPSYAEGWKDRFGVTFEEHKKALQVSVFDKYVVFNVNPAGRKNSGEEAQADV